MNKSNLEVSGARNPLELSSRIFSRISERARPDFEGKIRPNGTLRIQVCDELGRVEPGMVFPCEWLDVGGGQRLALIRNPYAGNGGEDCFFLCLGDGRVFIAARNVAVARLGAFVLSGRLKAGESEKCCAVSR